ncbi:hypothetical protein BDB01DRAFT_577623 [Pilobolus umbonatus]|nr:hypothetical protein BDB01DRAFT_577623 [Pilobolus umbonatus]
MFNKEYTVKAVNIVRPSPYNMHDSYSKAFNTWPINTLTNTVGVNPHRFLMRARSDSNLSTRSTFFSNLSLSSFDSSSSYDNDLDTIDGLTDDEYTEEKEYDSEENDSEDENVSEDNDSEDDLEEEPKIVAKMVHGTIMNGKGEFLNKGGVDDQSTWLDEARANRKIADLEIEKQSLLLLNNILEAKLRQQTERIIELQKKYEVNDEPLIPITVEEEPSGRVLQGYKHDRQRNVEETLRKLTVTSSPRSDITRQSRRVSDSGLRPQPPKMTRNHSRQSAPPVLITRPSNPSTTSNNSIYSRSPSPLDSRSPSPLNTRSPSPLNTRSPSPLDSRSPSPSPLPSPLNSRSPSTRQSSQLRRSQDMSKPKWHF